MPVFLQTRGRSRDYTFLGKAPDERWWSAYRNQTAFEDPTILVHSDGRRWRVCLSGIGSNRRDRVGTTIRYTLVLEGDYTDEVECARAQKAVGSWLADIVDKQPVNSMQAVLDEKFPEDFVESALSGGSREAGADVGAIVKDALNRLPARQTPSPADREARSWIGGIASKRAREAFMYRVHSLLGGAVGRALLLNLISTKEEADAVVEQGGPAAILIEGKTGAPGDGIVSLEEKKSLLNYDKGRTIGVAYGWQHWRSACPF